MKVDIVCPDCGREVSAADVNMERMLGRCSHCSILFPIPGEAAPRPRPAVPPKAAAASLKPRFAKPVGVTIEKNARGYKLKARWWRPLFIFLAFFAVAWDTFLIFWYAMALTGIKGGPVLLALLFPLLHVAVGVVLTYYVLTGFFNSTIIEIADGRFKLSHGRWTKTRSS